MALNRFYTPSLPVYTSQFVEDTTPWNEMLDFENLKLQRGDKAMDTMAQTDEMISSLIPGYQTTEVAGETDKEYKQALNQWIDKYGSSSYTVPAMRELSKIRSKWQADERVKTITRDREESQLYDRMRMNPDYRQETDPNINPETGNIRQWTSQQQYQGYQQPVYFADLGEELRKELNQIEKQITTGEARKETRLDKNSNPYEVFVQPRYQKRDEGRLKEFRDAAIKRVLSGETPGARYLKAITPEDQWNEEYISKYIDSVAEPFRVENDLTQESFIRPSASTKSDDDRYVRTTLSPHFKQNIPNWTPAESKNESDPNLIQRNVQKAYETVAADNGKLYDMIKDNPENIVRLSEFTATTTKHQKPYKEGDTVGETLYNAFNFFRNAATGLAGIANQAITPDWTKRAIIKTRAAEDPYGTEQMFKNYFDEQEQLPARERKIGMGEREKIMGWIDDVKKTIGVDEKPFDNNFNRDRAVNAVLMYGDFDNAPFNDMREVVNTPAEQYTPQQNYWLKEQAYKAGKKVASESIGRVQLIQYDKDTDEQKIYDLFKIEPDSDGKISASGASATLRGRTVVPLGESLEDQLTDDEVNKLIKEDETVYYNGIISPGELRYGDGYHMFTVGTGKTAKDYAVSGDPIEIKSTKVYSNIYSYELPENFGLGNVFAVRNIDPMQRGGLSFDIVDAENKSKETVDKNTPYVSIDAIPQLTENGEINNEFKKINIFQTDVSKKNGIPDKYLKIYSEDNKDGYMSFQLPTNPDGTIDPITAEYFVKRAYYEYLAKKGFDVVDELMQLEETYKEDTEE